MSTLALILAGILWGLAPQAPESPQGRDAVPALTLRAAVGEALRSSPALRSAHDVLEVAAIQERLQQSAFGLEIAPVLQLGTLQNGLRQQQAVLGLSRRLPTGTELAVSADWMQFGQTGHTQRDAGVTVSASQSLLQAFGPARRANLTAARRASGGAARAVDEARQQLVLRTADAYFAIVRQELLAEAAAQARVRADRLRAASEARARVGLATQLDVMRAELLAAQAEASQAAQQEALEQARDDLKMLLGRPLEAPIAVDVREVPDAVAPVPGDPAALQAVAFSRRLDLREARDRVDDAARAEEAARWAALPDIQLTASYTRRGLGAGASSVFNDWLGGWRAGLSTSHGLRRQAAAAATAVAALTVRAAERDALEREQAVAAGVRAAHRALVRAAGTIEIQRKALAVAERQTRLAALRYERGLADNVDVIDAEMNLLQARTALIGARVDHALARMSLDRASGLLDPDRYAR
jgi:outer membrane protein